MVGSKIISIGKTKATSMWLASASGSAIKPFVYAAAFKKGYSPILSSLMSNRIQSVLFGKIFSLTISSSSSGLVRQRRNTICRKLRPQLPRAGNTSLAQSLNVRPWKRFTWPVFAILLINERYGHWFPDRPRPLRADSSLGRRRSEPLEMTGAYSVFANNG